MPGGDADLVDVGGADALLDAGRAVPRRRALAEEVRHELHHAGVDEQQVGVVEDHRGAGHLGVARVHEVIEESLPDLVCLHVLLSLSFLGGSANYLRLFDRTTVPVAVAALKSQRTGAAPSAYSAVDEAQPHRAPRVVPVQVDQHDALPGAQQRLAALHRHVTDGATNAGSTWSAPCPGDRARGGSGRRAAAAVPACRPGRRRSPAPVSMIATPAVACGTKTLHRPSPWPRAERAHRVGEVDDPAARGVDVEYIGVHTSMSLRTPICQRNIPARSYH